MQLYSSLSGPWLAPRPAQCSAPGLPCHVWVSVRPVCLVMFSPKLASSLLRWDLPSSPSSSVGGKWGDDVMAAAPSRPRLLRLRLLLPSRHVPTSTNFLSLAGWANWYAAGRAPITPFSCPSSLRRGLQVEPLQSEGVAGLHVTRTALDVHHSVSADPRDVTCSPGQNQSPLPACDDSRVTAADLNRPVQKFSTANKMFCEYFSF